MDDTICAISTALGTGAISIIRVSGNESLSIVNKIFKNKDLTKVNSHTIHYGKIYDEKEEIDEVLISVMKAPKTFTKEDIIEINCHGGIAPTRKILEILIKYGCRLAEPGEFTKRAFLNGRIDLVEAEGIMNLISSKTEVSRKISINQLGGNVSKKIRELRQKIVELLANIAVNIDYPEYEDTEEVTNQVLEKKLIDIKEEISKIIKISENSKIVNEGIKVGIIGRPNVGKSSLLNALLEEEKAIVTDIAGTTRDIVEGIIQIDGLILNILDTAGIRETHDAVEKIGVEKSLDIINKSDLILLVLNNNEKITDYDEYLLEKIKNKKSLIIINKIDLENKIKLDNIKIPTISISAKNNIGIEELKEKIKKLFYAGEIESQDMNYVLNSRGIGLLNSSLEKIDNAFKAIDENMPVDIIEIEIKNAWEILGEIIGETYTDELIDQLFSQFCLGK